MVLLFTTEGCGGCRLVKAYLKESGTVYTEVMLDNENEHLFKEHNVRSAPTILFFKDEELIKRHEGFMLQTEFMKFYEQTL